MVSKVFEKLANNRIVHHLEKCGLFLISSMVIDLLDQLLIFSQLYLIELLGLLTGLGLLELIYPQTNKLKTYGISGHIFGLISFLSNRRLQVVLDGKSSQEYPVNVGVPQGSIFGLTLFLLYINDLPDDVICDIAIYADDTILYSKCDWASDLWQQLELASELGSDLWETLWTGVRSGLLISMLGKFSWFHLTSLITMGLLM